MTELDEFEVAAGDGVDDEVVVRLEEADVGDVRGGGALRLARVAQARARGGDRRDLAREAVALQRARAELFEEQGGAGGRLPEPVFEGRERQPLGRRHGVLGRHEAGGGRVFVLVCARRLRVERERRGVRVRARVSLSDERRERAREEQFAGRVGLDVGAHARPGVRACDFGRAEVPGREVEEGRAVGVARAAERGEVDGLLRLDEVRVDGRAGRDDAHDLAADELLRLGRVFGLLADGDAVALAYESRDVVGDGVVRDAAHGDGLAALLVPRGERDLKLARARDGVLEEQLVEVAEAEEEERAGVLPLELLVLPQHGRQR